MLGLKPALGSRCLWGGGASLDLHVDVGREQAHGGPGREKGSRSPLGPFPLWQPECLWCHCFGVPQFGDRQRGWDVLTAGGEVPPGARPPASGVVWGAREVHAGSAEFPGRFGSVLGGSGGAGLFHGRSSKCGSQQMLQ